MYYSQYKQDEMMERMVFKGYKSGIYMDIGAHDGVTYNNTLYFAKQNGWTGINVEPLKSVYDKLVLSRPNDINLNYAVANTEGTAEFMANTGYTEMISGLVSTYDSRHDTRLKHENNVMGSKTDIITVNTKRVETICDEYNITHINYLTIDVEGAEFEVIKSINFDKVMIDVIGFENNYHDTSMPIIAYLEAHNFKLIYKNTDVFMINTKSQFYKN